jgi:hypothetical protein
MTHDYVRNGTTSLFAAFDLASGSVIAQPYRRHRHQEFLRFLKLIDAAVPKDLDLHLVLAIAPAGEPIIPGRVEWPRAEMLKTPVAHGYCSRQLAAEACPYAKHLRAMRQLRHRPRIHPAAPGPARRPHRPPRRRRRTRLAHRGHPALGRHRQHSGPPQAAHPVTRIGYSGR